MAASKGAGTAAKTSATALTQRDFLLRKYEARMSLWKVIWGTALVGVASVLIPGAVQFWDIQFKSWREREQIRIQQDAARQESIKSFIDLALNEDIEHRLRLAEYFSVVVSPDKKEDWTGYFESLQERRRNTKTTILALEAQRVALESKRSEAQTTEEKVRLVQVKLELDWLYGELGRAPRGASVVPTTAERLTNETQNRTPVDPSALRRDTDMGHLHPVFRDRLERVLVRLAEEELPFRVFEGFRSAERQDYLWTLGRTRPGTRVTWSRPWGTRQHYGLGADLVLFEDGRWSWNDTGDKAALWEQMHAIAREEGLATTVNAKGQVLRKPYVHLPGIDMAALAVGRYPDGGDLAWASNLRAHIAQWGGPGGPDMPPIIAPQLSKGQSAQSIATPTQRIAPLTEGSGD
ncbi:M15 family metallopeptidase [Roseobacteraceae bacterium S113]